MAKGDKELKPIRKGKNGVIIYSNGFIRGPVARLCFVNFTTPKTNEDDDGNTRESYGCANLFRKGEDLSLMKKACRDFAIREKGEKGKRYKLPFRPQADKVDDYEGFVDGAEYFNSSSKYKPKCIGRNREEIELNSFYSGCYGQGLFRPYVYAKKGNIGIGLGLAGMQFIRDGEPLSGGGVDPEDWADDHEDEDIRDDDDEDDYEDTKSNRRSSSKRNNRDDEDDEFI